MLCTGHTCAARKKPSGRTTSLPQTWHLSGRSMTENAGLFGSCNCFGIFSIAFSGTIWQATCF